MILTRGSRPEAVLIPSDDYLRFQQMQESEVLARFDRVWNRLAEMNAAYSAEEVEAVAQDDKFLEAAVAGQADYLVTGDADLLALTPFEGMPVLRPSEFLARLKTSAG